MGNRNEIVIPPQGMWRGLILRLKLILRLMADKRVHPLVKLIPIGTLLYVLSPIDLIMGIPGLDALDDAAVLGLGSYLFLELCPPQVVQEHLRSLTGHVNAADASGEVVEADAVEIREQQNQ